ncbi:sulfatase [Rhodopirellula sp. MGV]|uniref:sulfatase n=1 Tax=Rhodopirellula sp. MGV TaxID=2023130 RepID=UPI000B969FD1|nr:sulfatase [Rhodopirellula sp. MGV]OYP33919.1 hypothetical protein CGZ80_17185 [Rhodopirellula sp. MGV]PNY34099.1 DUF4976 domain-containing protein [Rhodopirellula baltica]
MNRYKHTFPSSLLVLFWCCIFTAHDKLDAAEKHSSKRPNVIVFLVDDLGWRDLGCYGSPFYQTPNIDQLAERGMRFTSAYAACHVCSPTRASLLTGKYPARLQLTDWLPGRKDFEFQKLFNVETIQHLPLEEVTLAEQLKSRGYRTAHIGKWHLGEEPFGPTSQGFDLQIPRWNKGWPKAGYNSPFEMEGLDDKPGEYLTDRLTDEAIKFIEESQDEPFFLYLSHFAVHDPIEGREDFVHQYTERVERNSDPQYILEANPDDPSPLSRADLDARLRRPSWSGFKVLPERTVKVKQQQNNVQFAAMVAAMDESLGRIDATLTQLSVADDTIVVFFSDNGGMSAANFGRPDRKISPKQLDRAFSTSNLPLRGGKGWLYEGGIREPLIIYWPGQTSPGKVCDVPVISTDLMPTVLQMVDENISGASATSMKNHSDGVSLTALLRGETELKRDAIYWHFPHYSNHGMQSPGGAIRCGDFKLIEYFENGTVQLFDLANDIGEQNDLSKTEPEKTKELLGKLRQWRMQVNAQMPKSKSQPRDPQRQP